MTAARALATALAAEQAAVYGYGAAGPFVATALGRAVRQGYDDHRRARDALVAAIGALGATPSPAPPAYRLDPRPESPASAYDVLVRVEVATAAAYAGVLGATDDVTLRTAAVAALQGAAERAARWRLAAGAAPATEALPGLRT